MKGSLHITSNGQVQIIIGKAHTLLGPLMSRLTTRGPATILPTSLGPAMRAHTLLGPLMSRLTTLGVVLIANTKITRMTE
jgi:hypothetical protein